MKIFIGSAEGMFPDSDAARTDRSVGRLDTQIRVILLK